MSENKSSYDLMMKVREIKRAKEAMAVMRQEILDLTAAALLEELGRTDVVLALNFDKDNAAGIEVLRVSVRQYNGANPLEKLRREGYVLQALPMQGEFVVFVQDDATCGGA